MNIAVFGASGNIGSRVVALLLERGHTVTGLTHSPSKLPNHAGLKSVQGDIHSADDVEAVVAGSDVVISALGSWGTKEKDILTAGMKNIVPAMQKHSVNRIISLTGAGVLLPDDHVSWFDKLNPLLIKIAAPKILEDGANHINVLSTSDLDWTVIRSPVMKNSSVNGYDLQSRPPLLWQTISRDAVAQAMVDLIDSNDYSQSAPFITIKK